MSALETLVETRKQMVSEINWLEDDHYDMQTRQRETYNMQAKAKMNARINELAKQVVAAKNQLAEFDIAHPEVVEAIAKIKAEKLSDAYRAVENA